MFIKGVKRSSGVADIPAQDVTLAAIVPNGLGGIVAIVVNQKGHFSTATLDELSLPPRSPISGRHE
jgi:uncharacterized membrane protein YebE (DUF533 family)